MEVRHAAYRRGRSREFVVVSDDGIKWSTSLYHKDKRRFPGSRQLSRRRPVGDPATSIADSTNGTATTRPCTAATRLEYETTV